jgi:hypothetical protein
MISIKRRNTEFPYELFDAYTVEYHINVTTIKKRFIVIGVFKWDVLITIKLKA